MKSYTETLAQDRRLAVLRYLAEEPDYRLNTSILQDVLAAIGHSVSRDQLNADGAWLKDVGLIEVEEIGPVRVFTLTGRGLDAAKGRCIVPGVKRPSPR